MLFILFKVNATKAKITGATMQREMETQKSGQDFFGWGLQEAKYPHRHPSLLKRDREGKLEEQEPETCKSRQMQFNR